MTIPVQIAFQGGGARLALFFGAIVALQELERDKKIKVTRVAGASAGAVAAALFAGRANVEALANFHNSISTDLLRQAFPDLSKSGKLSELFRAGKTVVTNETVGDENAFAEILTAAFAAAGISAQRVDDLAIPCFINSTDIINHRSIAASPDSPLIQSLIDSAALPFLFRNGGQKIDGGILDNLPIEFLSPSNNVLPDQGTILAIAFPPDKFSPQVTTATELGKRLLETVINERVYRTKELLGPSRVYEIPVEYDGVKFTTFSVDSYMKAACGQTIRDNVRMGTRIWFDKFVSENADDGKTQPIDNPEIVERASLDQLRELADRLYRKSNLHLQLTTLEVTADDLPGGRGGRDSFNFRDKFKVGTEPVFSYVTRISINSTSPAVGSSVRVSGPPNGEFLPVNQFIIPDVVNKHSWSLVLLPDALVDDGGKSSYTVHNRLTIDNVMKPLTERNCDYLSIQINQAEFAEVAEIRLFVPGRIKLQLEQGTWKRITELGIECDDTPDSDNVLVEGWAAEPNDTNSGDCPFGYNAYIWKGENLKKGDLLRVIYTVKQ